MIVAGDGRPEMMMIRLPYVAHWLASFALIKLARMPLAYSHLISELNAGLVPSTYSEGR